MEKIDNQAIKKIVTALISGKDYRRVIVNIIDFQFLKFALDFLEQVADSKAQEANSKKELNRDGANWYKEYFLNNELNKKQLAINAGLNAKTIANMYNSTKKEVVEYASNLHFDKLYEEIVQLTKHRDDMDVNISINLGETEVELSIIESLIVINTIAVKRAEIRGGAWSKIGKNVEAPLMLSLCKLYGVGSDNYQIKEAKKNTPLKIDPNSFSREIDFYFKKGDKTYNCEIKLMGRGNPESADAVIARDSAVFVADKLSDTNKKQLDSLGIEWIELRGGKALEHFKKILDALGIPYETPPDNIGKYLDTILDEILGED